MLSLQEKTAPTRRFEGIHDGAHVYVVQYDGEGVCAGQWNWQVRVGTVSLSGVVATRALAERVVLGVIRIAKDADADIAGIVKEAREADVEDDATCPTCVGTGEGCADGERCWRCKGAGEAA